jgi:hypothetical protein
MNDIPIACTLSPSELRDASAMLLPGLARSAAKREMPADGIRLTFDPGLGVVTHIAGIIDRERECCKSLQFTLIVPPSMALVHLDVTGPPGTVDFLRDLVTEQEFDLLSNGR